MARIKLKCPAKINLFFNIVGINDKGYHLVRALNQSVSLYDYITIEKIESGIVLSCNNNLIPLDEKNSVYKACELFFTNYKINCGVKIHIDKNIPLEAGCGGESSDAAGTLVGLNELFDTKLSIDELAKLGYKIGCDVPFCIYGGSRRVSGCGEIISDWDNKYKNYLIIKPDYGFSTREAFFKYDSTVKEYKVIDEEIGHNDFHLILDYKTLTLINTLKNDYNCISMLTGSGSSIICIFKNSSEMDSAYEVLKNSDKFLVFKVQSCDGILFEIF